MIAGQIRNDVNFAGVELVEQVSPIVENNVFKFARNIVFQKLHVLIAVADSVSRSVLVHKARVDDVADLQLAVILFDGRNRFNRRIFSRSTFHIKNTDEIYRRNNYCRHKKNLTVSHSIPRLLQIFS